MHEVQREGLDNRGSQTVRSLRWQRPLAQMSKKLRLRALYDAVRAVKGGGASEADEPMVADAEVMFRRHAFSVARLSPRRADGRG